MKKYSHIELQTEINRLSFQIEQIKNKVDQNSELNILYNRLLIERAHVRKKLKEAESKNFFSYLPKTRLFKKRKKMICDYFAN